MGVALTESVPRGIGEWVPCYCCGRSYLATNMVSFDCHPDDALCVGCVAWLYDRRRPILRKLNPIWKFPARIRVRRAVSPVVAPPNHQRPEPTALYSHNVPHGGSGDRGTCGSGAARPP
jgi:hypothetical protein